MIPECFEFFEFKKSGTLLVDGAFQVAHVAHRFGGPGSSAVLFCPWRCFSKFANIAHRFGGAQSPGGFSPTHFSKIANIAHRFGGPQSPGGFSPTHFSKQKTTPTTNAIYCSVSPHPQSPGGFLFVNGTSWLAICADWRLNPPGGFVDGDSTVLQRI